MSFLAPLLLLAGVALAVPLILHLFRKKAGSVQAFPALRYLKRTTRERARIVRLRQLLLLALRLGALACLVLAAARLVLPLGGGVHPPAGVALVVDNGLTSARVVDDRRVLDHLVARAHAALDRTGPDDRVWLVAAGEPWSPSLPMDPDGARRAVDRLEPTAVRADLGASVARARSLLDAGAPAIRQVLVLSDFDVASLPRRAPPHPADGIPVALTTIADSLPPGRGFADVTVNGGLAPRAESPGEVSARVAGEPAADQAVRLRVDGRLVSASRSDEQGRVVLSLPAAPEGWLEARLEMDPDALRVDDVHHLSLPIRAPPQVHAPGDLPAHLAVALEVLEGRGRIERAAPSPGSDAGSGRPAVGLEAGGTAIPGSRPSLVFAPTDPARLPALNRRLAELGAGWQLEPAAGHAPLVVAEAAPETRVPEGLEVTLRHRLVPQADGQATSGSGRVLARLSDDSPWIVHVPSGLDGDPPGLLLVGSPPEPAATRLPTSAAMVPFLSAGLELLDGGEAIRRIVAGDPLPLPAEARQVVTPAGTRVPVSGSPSFLETAHAGTYEILGADDRVLARMAVNPEPAEAGPPRLILASAAERLGPEVSIARTSREWTRSILPDRRGREVWWPLLLAALALLAMESLLAAGDGPARAGAKKRETGGGSAPRPAEG